MGELRGGDDERREKPRGKIGRLRFVWVFVLFLELRLGFVQHINCAGIFGVYYSTTLSVHEFFTHVAGYQIIVRVDSWCM